MEPPGFLYPVSLAVDFAALAAIIVFPILGFVSLGRYGWRHARSTIAYLGYVCCALLVASFTQHLFLDGGEIMMVAVLWFIPFAVAAAVAFLTTAAIVWDGTLWSLALATMMLALTLVLADRQSEGIGGGLAILVLAFNGAYALLVMGLCAYRHGQWWRWPRDAWGR